MNVFMLSSETKLSRATVQYYRGKGDMAGTMEGIVTTNSSTAPGGILNRFIDVIQQDEDTSFGVFEAANTVLYAKFVYNKTAAKGDEYFVFAPINLFGAGIGAAQDSAQAFSASFRFATSSLVNVASYQVSF
jgi:hypothetical protein